jgi:hypothetical protein
MFIGGKITRINQLKSNVFACHRSLEHRRSQEAFKHFWKERYTIDLHKQ